MSLTATKKNKEVGHAVKNFKWRSNKHNSNAVWILLLFLLLLLYWIEGIAISGIANKEPREIESHMYGSH